MTHAKYFCTCGISFFHKENLLEHLSFYKVQDRRHPHMWAGYKADKAGE